MGKREECIFGERHSGFRGGPFSIGPATTVGRARPLCSLDSMCQLVDKQRGALFPGSGAK